MATIQTPRQIGLVVRKQRKALDLTQKQLAAAADVSERLIIALELGDATSIRIDKLLHILQPLGLTLSIEDPNAGSNSNRAESISHVQLDPKNHATLYDEAFAKATERLKPSPEVQTILKDAAERRHHGL